jgi:SAM-dependent methyltransferase
MKQFMLENKGDIRGHCLEFQEDIYTSAFGQGNVTKLDLLHQDGDNPQATIVADLTKPNSIPDDTFDCIICTMVLNMILDLPAAIRDLHRILKPGGVLLATVPHIAMYHPDHGGATHYTDAHGVWRFTPKGLSLSLSAFFGENNLTVRSYGNSLCAAAEIRGVVSEELPESLLNHKDEYFPVTICARAVKAR